MGQPQISIKEGKDGGGEIIWRTEMGWGRQLGRQESSQAHWQAGKVSPLPPACPPFPLAAAHIFAREFLAQASNRRRRLAGRQPATAGIRAGRPARRRRFRGARQAGICFYQLFFQSWAALTSDPVFSSFHLSVLQKSQHFCFFPPAEVLASREKGGGKKNTPTTL